MANIGLLKNIWVSIYDPKLDAAEVIYFRVEGRVG